MTSNDFLLDVVKRTNLNVNYFEKVYKIDSKYVSEVPFVVTPTVSSNLLPQISYDVKVNQHGFTIVDPDTDKSYSSNGYDGNQVIKGLPFKIQLSAKFEIAKPVIPAGRYETLKIFFRTMIAKQNEKIVIKKI